MNNCIYNKFDDPNYQTSLKGEIDNPKSTKEIEFEVKNLSTKKTLDSDGFTGEF